MSRKGEGEGDPSPEVKCVHYDRGNCKKYLGSTPCNGARLLYDLNHLGLQGTVSCSQLIVYLLKHPDEIELFLTDSSTEIRKIASHILPFLKG